MVEWRDELATLLNYQLKTFFMFNDENKFPSSTLDGAISSTQCCINAFRLNYFGGDYDKEIVIRPFHSIEYCIFLYWLSHRLFLDGNDKAAAWVYYLNKLMNCVELFYEIELPSIWMCEHPLGSIMGRAKYGDYFFFYQGCTVGANFRSDGSTIYPEFGNHVKMLSNSKVIGDSHIGNNVIIAANTYIKDADVPNNVIVFGQSPDLEFVPNHFIHGCKVDNILSK